MSPRELPAFVPVAWCAHGGQPSNPSRERAQRRARRPGLPGLPDRLCAQRDQHLRQHRCGSQLPRCLDARTPVAPWMTGWTSRDGRVLPRFSADQADWSFVVGGWPLRCSPRSGRCCSWAPHRVTRGWHLGGTAVFASPRGLIRERQRSVDLPDHVAGLGGRSGRSLANAVVGRSNLAVWCGTVASFANHPASWTWPGLDALFMLSNISVIYLNQGSPTSASAFRDAMTLL